MIIRYIGTSRKSNQLRNINIVRWESSYITTLLKFCWIYIRNIFLKFRVIDVEYIAKVPRSIVKLVYEIKPFGPLEVWHKILRYTWSGIVFGRVLHVESKDMTCGSLYYLSNLDILQYVIQNSTPPAILRLCIALFAVAEGWLLLDIGWFALFMYTTNTLYFIIHQVIPMYTFVHWYRKYI